MVMWCMMNAPLMLGLDLRRVEKGDSLYNIIANEQLIALNQDPLGVQAKRIYSSILTDGEPADLTYLTDINRVDILAKPLADGSIAVSFINVSERVMNDGYSVTVSELLKAIGDRLPNYSAWEEAKSFTVCDLLTGKESVSDTAAFAVSELAPCDNVTIRVKVDE